MPGVYAAAETSSNYPFSAALYTLEGVNSEIDSFANSAEGTWRVVVPKMVPLTGPSAYKGREVAAVDKLLKWYGIPTFMR